jgi:hypothetical protein
MMELTSVGFHLRFLARKKNAEHAGKGMPAATGAAA